MCKFLGAEDNGKLITIDNYSAWFQLSPPIQCRCTLSEHNSQADARTPAYIALFLTLSEEIIF